MPRVATTVLRAPYKRSWRAIEPLVETRVEFSETIWAIVVALERSAVAAFGSVAFSALAFWIRETAVFSFSTSEDTSPPFCSARYTEEKALLTELVAVASCPPVASYERIGIVEITRTINVMVVMPRHRAKRLNRLPVTNEFYRVAGYISLSMSLDGSRESFPFGNSRQLQFALGSPLPLCLPFRPMTYSTSCYQASFGKKSSRYHEALVFSSCLHD